MNKKLLAIGALVVLLVIGASFWFLRRPGPVLDNGIGLVALMSNGKPTGTAFVRVPYLRKADAVPFLNIAVNLTGKAGDEKWIVKNVYARTKQQGIQKFYFDIDPAQVDQSQKSVQVVLMDSPVKGDTLTVPANAESKKISVAFSQEALVDLVETSKVTKPELSMKEGSAAPTAKGLPDTYKNDVPDLKQRKAECAPTAAANGLINLAGEHGMIGNLPGTPTELIDQLKGDMNWTPADGVVPPDFVAGKNRLAAKLGLPITTTQVGDAHGADTLGKVMDGLNAGGAAEIRLRFADHKTGKTVGGHMVTVTNVYTQDGRDFIDVHDPLSSEGTDTYEVRNWRIMGYGRHPGVDAYVSFGFVQTWTGTLTGGSMQPLTPGELQGLQPYAAPRKVKCIVVQGHNVPLSEVYVGTGPDCDLPHYHASRGTVTALDGAKIVDPEGCGFGRVRNVPVIDVEVK